MVNTVTLKDVADEAGVSLSTASRALSGKAAAYRISQSTIETIQAASERLGFRPSHVSRSLRLKRSDLIGIVVPDISNPFFAAIAKEVTLAAEKVGISVIIADSQEQTEREVKLVDELMTRRVDALVVCPVGIESKHLKRARQFDLPVVLVDRTFPKQDFLQVTSRHQLGAQRAIEMLTSKGHRKIGIVQGLQGTLPNEARLAGVKEGLRAAGIRFVNRFVAGDNFTEQSGYDSAHQLLRQDLGITAIFAFSIPNAFGALRAIRELKLNVPEDLSMIAFDDSPVADLLEVKISTVTQDIASLGRRAGELVVRGIKDPKAVTERFHEIDIHVRERDSVCEVKKDDK